MQKHEYGHINFSEGGVLQNSMDNQKYHKSVKRKKASLKKEEDEIKVTVYCLTYNHAPYIKDALEGFINQKTTFKYQVIVHDDASIDETASIIREYADKYPDIIIPILQKENQYSKKINILATYIYPKIRGKYIAVCEGDDFWSSENKLQLQYEVMEENSMCVMCAHYVDLFDVRKSKFKGSYPMNFTVKEGILEMSTQLKISLLDMFQLSSCFFRKSVYDKYIKNIPEYAKVYPAGDVPVWLFFYSQGPLYFIDKHMSVYRCGVQGSWTTRIRDNQKKMVEHTEQVIKSLELYKEFLGREFDLIDYAIKYTRIEKEIVRKNYKFINLKENRDVIKTIPWKAQIKFFVFGKIPFMEKIYENMKKYIG